MQYYVWKDVLAPKHMANINTWHTRDNVLFKRQSSESVAVAADSLTHSLCQRSLLTQLTVI